MRNLITTIIRLAIAFVVLWILRVVFYLYNAELLGVLMWDELPSLLWGTAIFDAANMAYTFGIFAVLSLIPFPFRAGVVYQKILYWYFVVGITALTFFNLCDTVYFHYARKRGTIDEFSYAENDNTLQVMLRAAWENWYIALLGLFIIVGSAYLYRRVRYVPSSRPRYVVNSVIFVMAVLLLITAMRGGIGRAIRPITLSNAAQFAATPMKANIILSNPFCILRTIGNDKIRYTKYFTDRELDSLYTASHVGSAASTNDSTAIRGRNVVIFIMESFSYEHSAYLNPHLYADGVSYMPFLDSLMQQGYVFDRAYANGRKSIDALPSILASIPSFKTPFAVTPQALSPMRPLGGLLAEEGYETWFFNGSEERSMGFVAFAKSAGFSTIRTRENYEKAHGTEDYDGYWGIWDEPFLGFMAEELATARQPFIAATFTLSSHHPFVVPDKYKETLPKGKTKVQQPVAYTDLAMRNFFEAAKAQDWYKNTIFVIVADHVSSETYSDEARTDTGNSHIIQFIFTPDGSIRGRDSQVTQQIDLMPTILGRLGYEKPYFAFGQDAFGARRNGFAINYTGAAFQWIDSSGSYNFDEVTTGNAEVDERVKAFVQSYYRQMERGEFLVKQTTESDKR